MLDKYVSSVILRLMALALLIGTDELREAVYAGRPVWPGNSHHIFCYCPKGHLNPFPPKYGFCLCGFNFEKLIKKYHIRYHDVFELGEVGFKDLHFTGDEKCKSCWTGYPMNCGPFCDGLMHASFGDDGPEGYSLYTRCDKCGRSE